MRCEDAQSELLAGRAQSSSAELEAHVQGCDACRSLAERQSALNAVLALDEPHQPGLGFDTRFFARLDEERGAARTKRRLFSLRMWLWALVPAAAGVALLVSRPGHPTGEAAHPPEAATPALLENGDEPEDLELVMEDPELLEELDVVQRLDDLEDLDLLEGVDPAELDRLATETAP